MKEKQTNKMNKSEFFRAEALIKCIRTSLNINKCSPTNRNYHLKNSSLERREGVSFVVNMEMTLLILKRKLTNEKSTWSFLKDYETKVTSDTNSHILQNWMLILILNLGKSY